MSEHEGEAECATFPVSPWSGLHLGDSQHVGEGSNCGAISEMLLQGVRFSPVGI